MKESSAILASVLGASQFQPLRQHRCYRQFFELLPPRFRKAIAFVTVKNRQLMVGLSHPGYKMELNYNQELLKSLLSTLIRHRPECAFMKADRLVFFHSRYHPLKAEDPRTVPRYRELARGDFQTLPEDEALRERFERIRHWIRKNRENAL